MKRARHARPAVADSRPGGQPAQPAATPRRRRRAWRWLAILAACAGLGLGAAQAWRWYSLPARVEVALPDAPAVAGWPPVLGERLAAARERAATRAGALEGVAELGRLYHANGFSAEGEACWRFLRREQPGEARWAHLLADLRRAAGDYDEMEALLREVVDLASDYSPAWLQLGNHLFKTGRFEEAERAFARRLALAPGDPYARLGLARIAIQGGRQADAQRSIESLVKDQPRFAPAQNLLAELLAAAGDETGAARHRHLGYLAIRYFEPDDPWLNELTEWCFDAKRLRVLATIEYQIERGDQGVALMERAARLTPSDPDGYATLGDLFIKLGQAANARDALRECLRLAAAPDAKKPAVMVFVNLSHAYRLLKQPADALRVLEQARAQHPQAFELFDELGIVLGELGRPEESIAAFRVAIEKNPGDPNANFNLAVALLGVDRRDEAYQALHQSLTLKPTFPQSLSLLGRLELEDGRMVDAEKHLRLLYASYPNVAEARHMLGQWELITARAAEARKDWAAAVQHYRAGVSVDPDNPELQAGLGVMLLVHGPVAEAVAPLEAYRRLQPGNAQASLFLGQAYARLGRITEARAVLAEGAAQADKAGNAATAAFCREILSQLK
jgi:HemY protein